jgi:hypothetical protein
VSVHRTIFLILGCKKNLKEKDESRRCLFSKLLRRIKKMRREGEEFEFPHYREKISMRENSILSPYHSPPYFTSWTN